MKKILYSIILACVTLQNHGMKCDDLVVAKYTLAGEAINRSDLEDLRYAFLFKNASVHDNAFEKCRNFDIKRSLLNHAIQTYSFNLHYKNNIAHVKNNIAHVEFRQKQTNLQDIVTFLIKNNATITESDVLDAQKIKTTYQDSTLIDLLEPCFTSACLQQ
jgi:hypothetical protein